MQERWIKRRSSESLAGRRVEGDRLSQETPCYVCNERLGLEGSFPNPLPRQMFPVWCSAVSKSSFSLCLMQSWVITQLGLVYRSRSGREFRFLDRKRISDLFCFSVLDRNRPATFSCSCIFCAKQLRPLIVPRKGWKVTGQ